MVITIQMLVAAFNQGSSSSGTNLSTVLFPGANVVFNTSNTCEEVKSKLNTLQTQLLTCQDDLQNSSITYTSLCGSNALAVGGLDKIRSLIPQPATTDSAVVILTDGEIGDPDSERDRALNDLSNSTLRVTSIIVAGIRHSDAIEANLRLYNRNISNDSVVLANDAISLSIDLVAKMEEIGLICSDLGN